MGYIFLMISLFAGTLKGYCGKKTSSYTVSIGNAIFANTIRMILCILIGFLLIFATEDLRILIPSRTLLLISALSGISSAVFVVTWLISVKKSAYMMLDIFLMLGVLIPLSASSLFFSESIKPTQWLGIIVLFIAVVIMCAYNNDIKTKLTFPALILLLICGIANGFADFSQKLFVKALNGIPVELFNFYTYLFSLIALLAFCVLSPAEQTLSFLPKKEKKKVLIYVLIMSVFMFLNTYFKTRAAVYLDSVILYPLHQGGSLLLSSFMSAVLFGEKITPRALTGIMLAFISLIIINVL